MRHFNTTILSLLVYILAIGPGWSAQEQRKVTREDIELGNPDNTVTTLGGHTGHKISNFGVNPPVVYVPDYAGDEFTDAPIQAAFDNNPTGNATIYIPAGRYTISTELLYLAPDNVTIRGDGIGRTILDASALDSVPERSDLGFTRSRGILTLNPMNADTGAGGTTRYNIIVEDITFELGTDDPSDVYQKLFYFANLNNVTIRNCEFVGGFNEAQFSEADTGKWLVDLRWENNIFRNNVSNSINPNTGSVKDAWITGNKFDTVARPINILGFGVDISGNTFRRVSAEGALLGDCGPAVTRCLGSYSVTNNRFIELGYGAANGATVYGIHLIQGGGYPRTDNTLELGTIISWNSFDNTQSPASGSVWGMNLRSNALVTNNTFGDIDTTAGNDVALRVAYYDNTWKLRVKLDSNTVEDNPAATSHWGFGIAIDGNDNTEVYMSSNKIQGINYDDYGLYITSHTTKPFYSLNGDIFHGQISMAQAFGDYVMNYPNREYDNTAIYGDSQNGFRTATTADPRPATAAVLTDNSATPTIQGGSIWWSNNSGATTITNFLGGLHGREITVIFLDNNTTIANGATIKLAGATNFVATPNDSITFIFGYGDIWYEKGRSVN